MFERNSWQLKNTPPMGGVFYSDVVIGVDVGGTTIKVGVVAIGASDSSGQLVVTEQVATPRLSPPAFYDAVADLVRRVYAHARWNVTGSTGVPSQEISRSEISAVAVAHPGRFLPDGALARGTTPNLGAAPGEFDGLRPAQELKRRLGVPVFAENDAVAQMRFGLSALLRDPVVRPQLLGEIVVYLGPGTGMGGGVARVDQEGAVRVITDGHLFDLQIPGYGDGTLTTEELFTGPAMARCVSQANRRLSVPIEPATSEQVGRLLDSRDARPEHQSEAQRIADLHGDLLALIIETIHAARIVKVRVEPLADGTVARYVDEPDRAWPEADKAAVRRATRFILGGSIGVDRALGGRLRARALEALKRQGLSQIAIFQIPVRSADAGILGAVQRLLTRNLALECGMGNAE